MNNKTTKKGQPKPERVTKLSSGYSISKRAPLNPMEIKKIHESILKDKNQKK